MVNLTLCPHHRQALSPGLLQWEAAPQAQEIWLNIAIEIVDFPMKSMVDLGSFNSYVKLPEGNNQKQIGIVLNLKSSIY